MAELSAVQRAMLAEAQAKDPTVTEADVQALTPAQTKQWMERRMMSGASPEGPGAMAQVGHGLQGLLNMAQGAGQLGSLPMGGMPGPEGQQLAQGMLQSVKNAGTTMAPFAHAMGGDPGAALSQMQSPDYRKAALGTAGNALMALAPEASPLLGAAAMGVGGAAQTPEEPLAGATAGLIGGAGPKALGALTEKMGLPALARRVGMGDPAQRAANLMNNQFLPAVEQPGMMGTAAGGAAQIPHNAATLAPAGLTTANPTLAELMGEPGTKALTEAVGDNPALAGPFARRMSARAEAPFVSGTTTPNPAYEPDLAGGIRQATKMWADPLYDAMRANHPEIEVGSTRTGITIGEGLHMPKETAAYQAAQKAMATYMKGRTTGSASVLDQPIPGFDKAPAPGISDILSTPVVKAILDKAQTEQGLGVRPEEGTPYSFGQAQRAVEVLNDKADALWKSQTGDKEVAKQLKAASLALQDEIARQVPEYGPTQQEYAKRSELASQAEAKGGQFKAPSAPGVPSPNTPMSASMRMVYNIVRPALKFGLGQAHQHTMAELASLLTSQGGDINSVLAQLAARRPGAPVAPIPFTPTAGVLAGANQH